MNTPASPPPSDSGGEPNPGTTPERGQRQSAVALTYREGDNAPRVVAKGYGVLADTILRTAREHGLYVHESPELVGLLMQVDLDTHIPPQLYQAVAELLAWLYRLEALDPASAVAEAEALAASSAGEDSGQPGVDTSSGATSPHPAGAPTEANLPGPSANSPSPEHSNDNAPTRGSS